MDFSSSSDEDGHTRHTSSISPRFFKIIVEDTLRNHKLMLPKKFTTILQQDSGGDDPLPNRATLALPNGGVREIKVTTDSEGGVWLDDGFNEFAQLCSLAHGYLLLFKHRGEFRFSVNVYNNKAMKIQFPSLVRSPTRRSRSSFDGHNDPEADGQFPDLPPQDISSSSSFDFHASGGRGHDDDDEDDTDEEYNDDDYEEISDGEFAGRSWRYGRKKKTNETGSSSRRHGRRTSASSFNGGTTIGVPPSFTATMTETYISLRQAYIPREFSERYMKESEKVGLKVGERVWEMKLSKIGGAERKRKNTRITGGWTRFARDNALKIGDVCFFQLFDHRTTAAATANHQRRPLLHVTILRDPHGVF